MKLFLHGLFVGLGLLMCAAFAGCGTAKSGSAFFMDTPQPRANVSATAPGDTGVASLLPHSVPTLDVARFRVGQTVDVTFAGPPEAVPPFEEVIKEDGTITMPLIGRIYCLGKTAGELQNEIYSNYVPKYYVRLNVTVKPGDRVFYVGGEVGHAGVFQYISDTTVTKAIQAAGGLTPFSSHSHIWLTHAITGKRYKVNYDEALKNPAKDLPVYPDDQINVEPSIF